MASLVLAVQDQLCVSHPRYCLLCNILFNTFVYMPIWGSILNQIYWRKLLYNWKLNFSFAFLYAVLWIMSPVFRSSYCLFALFSFRLVARWDANSVQLGLWVSKAIFHLVKLLNSWSMQTAFHTYEMLYSWYMPSKWSLGKLRPCWGLLLLQWPL